MSGDLHRKTAARMFGVDPAEVTPEQIIAAKAANYGWLYGRATASLHPGEIRIDSEAGTTCVPISPEKEARARAALEGFRQLYGGGTSK